MKTNLNLTLRDFLWVLQFSSLPPQNQLPANYIWLCGAVLQDHIWTV